MKSLSYLLILLLSATSCRKNNDVDQAAPSDPETMYFPANTDNNWETKSASSLGWNENAIESLNNFLDKKNTKSFIILVNGRIVIEEYFNGHNSSAEWEWNSAGKTLVTNTLGIAQQEAFLNINSKVSDYLGTEWTNMLLQKENLITVRHLLTMTSGINETPQLVIKQNLTYVADAGTRWAYGNVFQRLMDVVSEATNQDFELYFNTKLKTKIGMDGFWNNGLVYKIYHSNTRSMARFGLLSLNKGKWENEQILNESFYTESTSSSQSINNGYGYLWWLNGKTNYMEPGSQAVYSGALVSNAPTEMYAAMGANDQRIYIIPSKNIVVVRMGDASDPTNPNFTLSNFDNDLWSKINAVIE
jgi:CubicO group peptidase (beta-lactamase class C family)